MTFYSDTSVIVPLFIAESTSSRAEALLTSASAVLAVSDFSEVEFASAITRRARVGDITSEQANVIFGQFESWIVRNTEKVALTSADLIVAKGFLRRLNPPLKTGDAMQIAVAQRLGATLATFDRQMARSAESLGVPVATG